jgi:hypothetical protein
MAVASAAHPSVLTGDGQVAECGQITGLIGAEQPIAVAGKPAVPGVPGAEAPLDHGRGRPPGRARARYVSARRPVSLS